MLRHYLFDYKKAEEGRLVIPNQRFLTTEEMTGAICIFTR